MSAEMSMKSAAEIKKTEWTVAANFESVGPKRDALNVSNSQREAASAQTKGSAASRDVIISSEGGDPAVRAIQWTDRRMSQITKELSDPNLGMASRYALLTETDRLSVAAETVMMAARARQALYDTVMRNILLSETA